MIEGKRPRPADGLSRREWLAGTVALPLWRAWPRQSGGSAAGRVMRPADLQRASGAVITIEESAAVPPVELTREWTGDRCRARVTNRSVRALHVKEVVLADCEIGLPPSTHLYGEGFQMLTQTGGTLGRPADLGSYTDAKHYRLPTPEGVLTIYGLMTAAVTIESLPPHAARLLLCE